MPIMPFTTVKIDNLLLAQAEKYGEANNRSAIEQLEY